MDSTSVLTTEKRHFTKGNHTEFSIDLAIVFNDRNGCHRLIHEKTGFTAWDRYYWNLVPNSRNLFDKVAAIKDEHLWDEVIDEYLEKKNMYLRRQDYNHPSFNVYVETVNQVFNKYFDWIPLSSEQVYACSSSSSSKESSSTPYPSGNSSFRFSGGSQEIYSMATPSRMSAV